MDLSLTESNCESWYDNSIDRIGNRVFVNLSIHVKISIIKGNPIIIAAISKKYSPKANYISFPCVTNLGKSLFGYIDKSTGRIILMPQNGDIDAHITASFSYRAD